MGHRAAGKKRSLKASCDGMSRRREKRLFIWTNRGWRGYLSWLLRYLKPGSKRGRVNINAQLGVPEALPVLTGPQPASSGSPLGRMSPHPQGHQDEHPQDAQVHQGSGSSSIRDSLLASLCFVVPWLPGCSQGSTLPPSAAPPTCSFSL